MFTCTTLCHAYLEWQKNNHVHPKASQSKLKAARLDRLNFFNHKNDGGKNASWCAATGRKLLTLPGVADTYIFLMNTWNTLLESYQLRVYKNTLAPVKRQIHQAENPTPAAVISVEEPRVDNALLLDYLASEVALEEPEIRSTDPNIPIDNNSTDDKHHLRIPGGSGDYKDEGDGSDLGDAVPTASRRRRPASELKRFDLGTSDVDRDKGKDGDNADPDEQEEASAANDGSTQNVED